MSGPTSSKFGPAVDRSRRGWAQAGGAPARALALCRRRGLLRSAACFRYVVGPRARRIVVSDDEQDIVPPVARKRRRSLLLPCSSGAPLLLDYIAMCCSLKANTKRRRRGWAIVWVTARTLVLMPSKHSHMRALRTQLTSVGVGPNSSNMGGKLDRHRRPKVASASTNAGAISAEFLMKYAKFVRNLPNSDNINQLQADFDRVCADRRPNLAQLSPNMAKFDQLQADFIRLLNELGQFRPKFARSQFCPIPAEFAPMSTELGPSSNAIPPDSADTGQIWSGSGQTLANFHRLWLIRPKSGDEMAEGYLPWNVA